MKVMTVVGTRPEIIRLSRVIRRLDETVDHVLVHTGQNYDHQLNQVFFDDLGLRAPDHYLDVDTSSLGRGPRRDAGRHRTGPARGAPGRGARPRGHQQLHRGRHGQAAPHPDLPHGGRQPLLRRERARGDEPPPRRPRRRLQPRLHRARPAQPARRGAAPAPHPPDGLADAGGARRLPRADPRLGRPRSPRPDRGRLLPRQRPPGGERRLPRAARDAARMPDGRPRRVRPPGLRLHPPADAQAARGAARLVRARGRSPSATRSASTTTTGSSWRPPAACPTPARSPRSRACSASPPSRSATRSSDPRPSTPGRS